MKPCPVRYYRNGRCWTLAWTDDFGAERRIGGGSMATVSERDIKRRCAELAMELGLSTTKRNAATAPSLDAWGKRYLQQATHLGDRTRLLHAKTLAYLSDKFGKGVRLDQIDRAGAAEWRGWLADKGLAEATVCAHVRNAKVVFRKAVEQDLLDYSPFDRLKGTARMAPVRFRELGCTEMGTLLAACPGASWRVLFGLCYYAGLRRGEALRLKWDDIDLAGKRIVVRHDGAETTKGRQRVVRLEPELAALLTGSLNGTVSRSGETTAFGELVCPVSIHNIHDNAIDIIKGAGLDPWDKPFHSLRKNRATIWRKTYPEHVVDSWLGHSLAVARQHYVTVSDEFYK